MKTSYLLLNTKRLQISKLSHPETQDACLQLIFFLIGYVLFLNTIHDVDVRYGCYISVVENQIELCCRSIFFGYVLLLNTIHDADIRYGCYISGVENQIELCCRSIVC
ncbi:hypothetical protein BLOT_012911 [Blomia tropicalis]|nr:hypothetical protein BLOT_012911 [Blomia tropicalis]